MPHAKRALLLISLLIAVSGAFFVAPTGIARADSASISFDDGGDLDYELYPYGANSQSVTSGGYSGNGLISATSTNPNEAGCGTPPGDAYVGITIPWGADTITGLSVWLYGTSSMPGTMSGYWQAYISGSWTNVGVPIGVGLNNPWYHSVQSGLNIVGATQLRFYFGSCWGQSLTAHADEISITYTDDGPTPTPTYTVTPTATATSIVSQYGTCIMLGARATFADLYLAGTNAAPLTLNNAWETTNADHPEDTSRYIVLGPGSSARTNISLIRDRAYSVVAIYRKASADEGSAQVKVGDSSPFLLPLGPGTQRRLTTIDIPPRSEVTSPTVLSVAFDANSPDLGLVIEYLCIGVNSDYVSPPIETGDSEDVCALCADPLGIWDIPGMLNWLLCNIGRFFRCVIGEILRQILLFIVSIIQGILGIGTWARETAEGAVNWISGGATQSAQVVAGYGSNVITSVGNGMHQAGMADDLNNISSGIRDLPTTIFNGVSELTSSFVLAIDNATNILDVVGIMVKLFFDTFGFLIGLIPLVIESLISGFNAASEPVSTSIICTNPNDLLYYPCLGFYILDNTIFQGPAFLFIPVIIGLMAFQTFIWIFYQIREALAGDA